jgi:hypothetical protein
MKTTLLTLLFLISFTSFAQEEEKLKYRKISYIEFLKYSINDTADAVVNIFFDKTENAGIGQMSFLPMTVLLYFLSPQLGIGLTAISLPLFLKGSVVLIKYRKKKLHLILNDYKETGNLPEWIRKKAIRELEANVLLKADY